MGRFQIWEGRFGCQELELAEELVSALVVEEEAVELAAGVVAKLHHLRH